ncbi:MAG TPA: CapA family protein, partial [Spirochaetia bacterium]|nr:CapA family protein [Spirochaetia bacterium]
MRKPAGIKGVPLSRLAFVAALAMASASCTASYFIVGPEGFSGLATDLSRRIEGAGGLVPARSADRADLVLYLHGYWSGRVPGGTGSPVLSREAWVPTREARTGAGGGSAWTTSGARLEECLSGTVPIMPLERVAPPLLAMPVDGLRIGKAGYPLWREAAAAAVPAGTRGRRAMPALDALLSAMEAEALQAAERVSGSLVWIAAMGDLMPGRGIDARLLADGPSSVFSAEVLRVLGEADLAIANLEGALTLRGRAAVKTFTFRSPPAVAEALSAAGLDAFLLANNHALDWGATGLYDTLEALTGAGLGYAGAGRTIEDAARPFLATVKGRPVAVWGAAAFPREGNGWDGAAAAAGPDSPGIFWLDAPGMARLASGFREDVLDLVMIHAGTE